MNERKLYACDKCNSKMSDTGVCWHCHTGHGVQVYPVPQGKEIAKVGKTFMSKRSRGTTNRTREYEI